MAQNLNTSILKETEYNKWDVFVQSSPQGTLFSSIVWLKTYGEPFTIFCCYKGDELVGGVAVVEEKDGKNICPLVYFTPFLGVLFRNNDNMKNPDRISLEKNIVFSLLEELEKKYHKIAFANHWGITDARPFYWHSYGCKSYGYEVTLRYTSVVNLCDIQKTFEDMDDDTKYEIRKAEKNNIKIMQEDDLEAFFNLQEATFKRQDIERPEFEKILVRKICSTLKEQGRCKTYFAKTESGVNSASAVIIWDNKRAYYMFGATDPETRNNGATSLLLWQIFKELSSDAIKEIDLVGVNSPKRGRFKIGFGGALLPYIFVENKFYRE
jgi:uncharacterized protein YwgA